jgi:tetratricopeptide (TPR) repeat protein
MRWWPVALLLALPWLAATAAATQAPLGDVTPPLPGTTGVPAKLAAAIDAIRRGDGDAAVTAARQFVQEEPRSAAGLEVLGAALSMKRQWPEAAQAFAGALKIEPRRVSAMVRLGAVQLETREPKKAEAAFRQAIGIEPDLGLARRGLALALLRQGRVREAVGAAQEAIRVSQGKDLDAKYLLAAILHELGRSADAERLLAEVLTEKPDAPAPLLLQGLVKVEVGKPDEATPLLQQVVARDPTSLFGRMGIAMARREQGDLPQAIADLEKLVQERPDWTMAHLQLGQTLLVAGRTDEGLRALDQAEKASPDPAATRVRVARIFLARGEFDRAIAKARAAGGSAAVASAARTILVQAYLAQGKPDAAERELRAAVTANPRDPMAAVQLGRFLLSRGRPREALFQFEQAARLRPGVTELLILQAEAHVAAREPSAAVAAANQVVKGEKESPESLAFLGSVHERLGQSVEAGSAYQRALDRQPGYLPAVRGLAKLAVRDNRAPEAIRLLQEAADANPRSTAPLLELAAIHQQAGDRAAAIAAYRRALERNADDVVASNNLAVLLGGDATTLEEGLRLAERAHRQAPQSIAVADTLGWLLFQKGDLDRAAALIGQAAKGAPENAEILYHLGAVYARQQKVPEARRALEQALAASPAFPGAAAARKLLEQLP